MLDARVTDCDVQTAEFTVQTLEHGLHLFFLGDVGFEGDGAHVKSADLLDDGLSGRGIGDVVYGYVCSALGEF